MEREQVQRERQREGLERSQEQAKEREPSREQRAFVASNIERCESRPKEREGTSALPAGSPPGDRPKDLQERFEKDFQAVHEIKGLNPEVWAKANEQQRLETLREMGQRLATSQNREAYRTYAVDFKEKPTQDEREKTRAETLIVQGGRNAAPGERLADGKYIRIREEFLKDEHPRRAFREAAEENRHAFQHDVLSNKNKHSEVDAETREKWQYGKDVYAEHAGRPELYKRNPLERDAKPYAEEMTLRMYGKDRSSS